MTTSVEAGFDVGGVKLARPFKIRRLGHFGFNVTKMDEALHFYVDLLGFRISDIGRWSAHLGESNPEFGNTNSYFMRHGGDHHSFVLFNEHAMRSRNPGRLRPEITINQITWQVGSLEQVVNATPWMSDRGIELQRQGRDAPGSNWHTYVFDPDGHTNELYYGIEQVGWNGHSKPKEMYDRSFRETPWLPQIGELQEVENALAKGIDLSSGHRHVETMSATFDVEGILLSRPFKVTRVGPVSLFADDIDAAAEFYTNTMGFMITEEVTWHGERCLYLRANTDHHCLALYPKALRQDLALRSDTKSMAFGLQLGSYRQLCDAVDFLRENGVEVRQDFPSELHPGIDYAAYAFDPDGHCIQLYYYMEQVGWDGKPRPAEYRAPTKTPWPDSVDAQPDVYGGEAYLGPWG